MTAPDFITLLLYLLGIFAISTLSARRISNQKDMFSAGRSSPWWVSGLSGFMTMFSAGTFVVWGGIAYRLGIVAVLINTCYGIAALLVGRYVAGRWNQLGVSTPAEYVRQRFGKTGLHFFTWTMMLKRILGVSVSLYALGVLSAALIPQGILSQTWAIIIFGVIVVAYTMQGGTECGSRLCTAAAYPAASLFVMLAATCWCSLNFRARRVAASIASVSSG